MTLVCPLCKNTRGDVYNIPVTGLGDVLMCYHVVECVVQIHRMVANPPEKHAPVACAA